MPRVRDCRFWRIKAVRPRNRFTEELYPSRKSTGGVSLAMAHRKKTRTIEGAGMMRAIRHAFGAMALAAILGGCGTAYISPSVPQDDPNVDVVPVTALTVKHANSATYTPRALPAVFFRSAGATGSVRGVGQQSQPSQLTGRLNH